MIEDIVRERGPLTVAAFMELALYDAEFGYYARAAQRSGRAGDFFTSVDVGPLFGQLLEIQLAEMATLLAPFQASDSTRQTFDLVEAGAGNGRLSADILRAAKQCDAAFYESVRLHLVEASTEARRGHRETLGDVSEQLISSDASLPLSFEGALVANELLDAFPVHQVAMREDGLRELYVSSATQNRGGTLALFEGPPSTPALQDYLDRLGVRLEPGCRVEINLRAVDWIRDAARRLRRGFIILIDYGHEARELYSPTHAGGTLTTYTRHRSVASESSGNRPAWLLCPGERDLTSHVDFTSVRASAEAAGLTTIGFLDQTYFLLGLLPGIRNVSSAIRHFKTLILPGGLGSTHKVLILGKGVGVPALQGCSFQVRVT